MEKIYLDNAATTPLRAEVIREMVHVLEHEYGNPSSTHGVGRGAKAIIENARKAIAKQLCAQASEILFTSSATEATNWILQSCVVDLGVQRIITSKIEHHATLYTVSFLKRKYNVSVDYVRILPDGHLDYSHLDELLNQGGKTLVSLMHVNNETGVVNDLKRIGDSCQQKNALFHCDTVQSVGKILLQLNELPVDFIVASAHKFHGPKGIGFAYIRKGLILQPLFYGGEQEKGWRAGTEAVHQIAGMVKALELAYQNLEEEQAYIEQLKTYCFDRLKATFPGVKQNGRDSLYTILNILLPFDATKTPLILFHLDMKGVAVSRGSACQSGSPKPSHVLAEMLNQEELLLPSLRLSFSHYNTQSDIDNFLICLQSL